MQVDTQLCLPVQLLQCQLWRILLCHPSIIPQLVSTFLAAHHHHHHRALPLHLWSVSACHHAVTSVVGVMQLMFLPCLTMHITATGFMAAACIHMDVLFHGHRDTVGQPHTRIRPLPTPTVWVSALGSNWMLCDKHCSVNLKRQHLRISQNVFAVNNRRWVIEVLFVSYSIRKVKHAILALSVLSPSFISFVMLIHPFICPHVTTLISQDRFVWSLIFEYFFSEICQERSNFFKIWQE